MKQASDPRHKMRIHIVEELFAHSFNNQTKKGIKTKLIVNNLTGVDKLITDAAPQWHISKISKIDLAILRLAVYELVIDKKEPVKVIIDEAVEIAKSYGNDRSPSFINGVLGTIVKQKPINMNEVNTQITEKKIIEIIAERLGIADNTITRDSYLFDDLNASKLEVADIIQTLEDTYELKFDAEGVKSFLKVGDIIDYLIDNAE